MEVMPPGRCEPLWTENRRVRGVPLVPTAPDGLSSPRAGRIHGGEPLAVHGDGLAGRVQLHACRGLRGILHHTNVAWWEAGGQTWGTLLHHALPRPPAASVTFVGPLGDAHGLPDQLVVSPAPASAHATPRAPEVTALTCCGGKRTPPVPQGPTASQTGRTKPSSPAGHPQAGSGASSAPSPRTPQRSPDHSAISPEMVHLPLG